MIPYCQVLPILKYSFNCIFILKRLRTEREREKRITSGLKTVHSSRWVRIGFKLNHRQIRWQKKKKLGHVSSHLMYWAGAFPWTTSLFTSTATISECGTSNIGSSSSFSCWEIVAAYDITRAHVIIPACLWGTENWIQYKQQKQHSLTIMDLSPRAPVLRSRANLAIALRASVETLRSH